MTLQNVTIVGGKEFAHPFYDSMLAFLKEEGETSSKMAGGKLNHNGLEVAETEMADTIGQATYLACEKLKTIEPLAVVFLPEKYSDLSIVEKAFAAYDERAKTGEKNDDFNPLAALFGGRSSSFAQYPPEMKAELEALEFTIVDMAAFPMQEDMYFKVVRNDNPEITGWIDSYSLSKKSKKK